MTWPPDIGITENPKHVEYLRLAYQHGWDHANDDSTKNGSLILNPTTKEILIYGECGLPDNLKDIPELLANKSKKYPLVKHAERQAVSTAAKLGKATDGMIMYCPWYACPPCADAIRGSGIEAVIGHEDTFLRTPDRWKKDVIDGIDLLHRAGIWTLMYRGKVGGVQALLDKEIWHP